MSFIVVGVDGSQSAYNALVAVVRQAAMVDAEVHAVNVIELPVMSGYEFSPLDLDGMREAAKETLDKAIERLSTDFGDSLPTEISTRIPTGHVGVEILRAAKDGEGAAMVVAGSRGLGGFRSLLLGSVTTYLAHHLTCPLLIIPADDDED